MNVFKTIAAASVLAMAASGVANAAVYYADKVVAFEGGPQTGSRSIKENALGSPDGKFYSLGLGGSLTLGFKDAPFHTADVSVFEITFGGGLGSGHREAADIYAVDSKSNTQWFLGTLDNVSGNNTVRGSAGSFDQIRLVDVSKSFFEGTRSDDGFDVDSVAIAPVPVPAAGMLLLAGLGGFAALRRRKTA
ncbi:VPLPA-CTERM sorting domain-containing protein [Paracoccus fontiphilus]|uniref:VPLPA-CTERM sorting domain-containing protein n=1 Tax=Paracoccus fontiphilus TaxID=1815556 RepID=A0ABV7IFR5_9RHOB|nr:VPLPA-CTERM sorting domain-containing protein [Paracoccus fontiphilus]